MDSKKKIPIWLLYLLGMVVCFVITGVGIKLENVPVLSLIQTPVIMIGVFGHMIFLTCLIVHGIRALIRMSSRGHVAPTAVAYRGIHTGTIVDGKPNPAEEARRVYVYNRPAPFRFNGAAEPLSWPLVIGLLITIFPAGLYFLIIKCVKENAYSFKNGAVIQVIGGIFALWHLLLFVFFFTGASLTDKATIVMLAGIFGLFLLGLCAFIYGTRLKGQGRENDTMLRLITEEGITNMDAIADRLHLSYAQATAIVDRLIEDGLLQNAYLYHPDREVIVPGISKKIVKYCPRCGGTTTMYSTEQPICSYCGGDLR